ncbi:class I SAM-dependent methyltransferase [Plantactinospora sp. CA-290183]|uniref:class I SAM-dependent methyltransferase n=1 Tax=Plantactinospora sp. CA-290183 TaxID=3240006 RepID=UPI003D8AE079
MPQSTRPHVPQRPLWLCRACARPWPCPTARHRLPVEYAADPVALHVYLASMLQDAIDDLCRLNPQPGPDPAGIYHRFLGWAAPRLRVARAQNGPTVADRLRWANRLLEIAPDDHVLEIGCGRGEAVSLICDRLVGGRIVAIDSSPAMVQLARERNATQIALGRAEIRAGSLADLDPAGERFDTVFAINVNLFWTRSPAREMAVVTRLLKPDAALHLIYEPPGADRAAELARRLPAVLAEHGLVATTVTATTTRSRSLLCVTGRPAAG